MGDINKCEKIVTRARTIGKLYQSFSEFVAMIRGGNRVQLMGEDFVAVDRKTWNEMQKELMEAKL